MENDVGTTVKLQVKNEKFDLNVGDLIPGDFVEDRTFTPGGSEAAPAVNLVAAVDDPVVVEKSVKTEAITQASVPYTVKAKDLGTVLSPTPRTGYDAVSQRKLAKDNPFIFCYQRFNNRFDL